MSAVPAFVFRGLGAMQSHTDFTSVRYRTEADLRDALAAVWCSPDELTTLVAEVYAEAAASQAAAERGEMALREAERCGCLIAVHGADVGSARVVHTCGAVA